MITVLLPAGNEADVAESFGDVLPGGIRVCYATTMDDVLEVVLPSWALAPYWAGRARRGKPPQPTPARPVRPAQIRTRTWDGPGHQLLMIILSGGARSDSTGTPAARACAGTSASRDRTSRRSPASN